MSLSKAIKLTVKDFKVELSSALKFYKNDTLKLIFTINQYGIVNAKGSYQPQIMPVEFLDASLLIETPNGIDSVESAKVEENTITFLINDYYTKNVGTTMLQIVLTDDDGCRVTLPPFEMEIKEAIGEYDKYTPTVYIPSNVDRFYFDTQTSKLYATNVFLLYYDKIYNINSKELTLSEGDNAYLNTISSSGEISTTKEGDNSILLGTLTNGIFLFNVVIKNYDGIYDAGDFSSTSNFLLEGGTF